jgi:hypothetical protein
MTDDLQTEDRLRSALRAHTDGVRPDEDAGLDRIRYRSAQVRTRRRVALAGVAATVVAVAAVTLPRLGDDGTDVETVPPAGGGTTATTETTTTTPGTATTEVVPTTEVPGATGVTDAVWPPAGAPQFADPDDAARAFVEDYVGIDDPPLGPFRSEGEDAGEIDVFTRDENGAVRSDLVRSTLSLRRAGDFWGVMSAQSDSIVVDNPAPLGAVGDPVVVDGRGRGFEALIVVTVRGAGMGAGDELFRGNTLAGCCEELEPFHIELPVDAPAGSSGSLLLQNDNPAGFGVPDFTVVPVHFVAGTGSQASDERTVTLYWSDASGALQPVDRTVRLSEGILRGTLQQYLFGPTSAERGAGLSSGLDAAAASASFDVVLRDGAAVIDFSADLPSLSPNTSTSAGSLAFLRQLHATVFQFPTVDTVEYRVGGSCEAFWNWLQRGCTPVTRDDPGV